MTKLTEAQQRYILESLPAADKTAIKHYCRTCEKQGDGIKNIVRKVAKALGPIVKQVGPKVLEEFIIPMLLSKAKQHYGGTLKLAGQGNPWILHCRKVAKDQGVSFKDAMKIGKLTYKK